MVKFALDNNLGVHFGGDYNDNRVFKDIFMKEYFLISDSFLYKNCEIIAPPLFSGVLEIEEMRKEFFNKFRFLDEINNILSEYKLKTVKWYFTSDGAVDCSEDFINKITDKNDFLSDLFESILQSSNEYAYEFPTVSFEVRLNSRYNS